MLPGILQGIGRLDMPEDIVDVAVGVITNTHQEVLLGSRPEGKPWSGWWEMPGGKLEPGESVADALRRELNEELGIDITEVTPWVTYVHRYPTTTVRLHFCRVTDWTGSPSGLENQQLKWVPIASATELPDLLPGAYPPLRWLKLPSRYLISSAQNEQHHDAFMQKLEDALRNGLRLVQWREPLWQSHGDIQAMQRAFLQARELCHANGAQILLNSCHPSSWWVQADGVHWRSADAVKLHERPSALKHKLLGISTHNADELQMARDLGADFVVLGPVLPTASHPGEPTLGWDAFEALNQVAGLPVYALGGQTPETLSMAQSRGAHGIAGIRQLVC